MEKNIIEIKNMTKLFPGVIANKDINLEIQNGEIHAIVGENGAGKSTLMNVLFGLYTPTMGEIFIKGEKTEFSSPMQATEKGIGMVHQHFMLIQSFTVLQNIILGIEPSKGLKIDYKKAKEKIKKISEEYGLEIDLSAKIKDISVPMQQRVEIIKVLYRNAEIIIFDEPTAVLTPKEIDEFCELVFELQKMGKTIVFISHKLTEVMRVSDRITVMRRGEIVDTLFTENTNESELAHKMVGHHVELGGGKREKIAKTPPVLCINNLSYFENNIQRLNNVNLTVRSGEIMGIAGIDGNGQQELIDIISGKTKYKDGSVKFNEVEVSNLSIKEIKDYGLSVVFEDRHRDGLIMEYSVEDNLILGYGERYVKNKLFLDSAKIKKNASKMCNRFDIRCVSPNVAISTLSGGNQQKAILAREISSNPLMIMVVQPTRGLDMGAIEFVHNKLVQLRNEGLAVLFFSLELDELLQISDRIAVIYAGEILKVLNNTNLNKNIVGDYMLGIKNNV